MRSAPARDGRGRGKFLVLKIAVALKVIVLIAGQVGGPSSAKDLSAYLQQTHGGGFGRDLVHLSKTTFSILGGIDYLHQRFENLTSMSSVQAMAGEKMGMQITKTLYLDHQLTFSPNLEHSGQYHFDVAAGFTLKINAHVTANARAIDLFVTNPHQDRRTITSL